MFYFTTIPARSASLINASQNTSVRVNDIVKTHCKNIICMIY